MAEGFLSGILGSKERESPKLEDYIDLDETTSDETIREGPADMYVKVGELKSLNDVAELKEEVYNGNILLIDVSGIEDELALERSIKDLRRAVNDIDGDIAAMGNDQVIVTPTAVKIERDRLAPKK